MKAEIRPLQVLPKKEETPTEIHSSTKAFIKLFYEDYQKDVKLLADIEQRHKQHLLDLLRRTTNEYSKVIVTYLQAEYSHWVELSPEDIEYIYTRRSK